jgi:AbrB family looped-hinge helix DNA binding protein
MAPLRSKVTAQGRTSIPAEIRRRLGLGPGSVVEWEADGDNVFVRRTGRYSSEDIHRALFPDGPPKPRTIEEMDEGIKQYMREKYARR